MGLACYSVFFFLFYLVFLIYPSHCKCQKYLDCGYFGRLEFPFSDNLECGLTTVVNCSLRNPKPKVQLGIEGEWVDVHKIISPNRLQVGDPVIPDLLTNNRRCEYVERRVDFLHPDSPLYKILYPQNITIFSCLKDLPPVQAHFKGFQNISGCKFADYYYKPMSYVSPPEHCFMINIPANFNQRSDDLFELLTSDFHVEVRVSNECLRCHNRGGRCLLGNNDIFVCKENQQKKVILVSAISASVAFLGLCFVISILIYRCKKTSDGYLLSRNISSAPSLKSDLDGGRFFFGIPIFSYQELEEATNNFDSSKELGDGGFGTVYYGILRDGREVAIKRLYEHNCRRVEQFMNEIQILTSLRHQNLVSLYGCTSRRSRELLLVYEYIPNGTVADHLYGEVAHTSPLTWPIRMSIAIETASALAYLHRSDIIHRDVKTNNILLDKNFCVKVADFGLSRLFPNDVSHISTTPQGTPGYVDPEYHQCYQLTIKSDVYSFGVVLIELISSMPAVDITRHRHEINLANLALNRIQRCEFDELIDLSLGYQTDAEVARMTTSVAELAFRCLQLEKDMRPSMDEVFTILKDIQTGGDSNLQRTKEGNGKYSAPGKLITSPETDDAVLLKGNVHSSPVTVTET